VGLLLKCLEAGLTRARRARALPAVLEEGFPPDPRPPVLQKVIEETLLLLGSAAANLAEICSCAYGVSTIDAKPGTCLTRRARYPFFVPPDQSFSFSHYVIGEPRYLIDLSTAHDNS